MFLLIDNYDSFTYNLRHYLGELGAGVEVRRNDALGADEAMALEPEGIVISPELWIRWPLSTSACDPKRTLMMPGGGLAQFVPRLVLGQRRAG